MVIYIYIYRLIERISWAELYLFMFYASFFFNSQSKYKLDKTCVKQQIVMGAID